MFIQTISLCQFKNYLKADIAFDKKVNCFVGENGAGKTNLLDAIYYTCISKSYFNNKEAGNILFEKDFFRIDAHIQDSDEQKALRLLYANGRKKELSIDQVKYEKLSEHVGRFPVVIITPDDNQLILGGSEDRRRFMDALLSQMDSKYLQYLQIYNRQLTQRNALLKRFAENGRFERQMLKAYEIPMAEAATYIAEKRKELIELIVPQFHELYAKISGEKEHVSLSYASEVYGKDMLELFEQNLSIDRNIRRSSEGVHRDDMEFEMNGQKVKRFASQGQQKSYLIALKLAQVALLEKISKKKPLLLLDDIFDKLDDQRGRHLLEFILNPDFGQVFISDTSRERIEKQFAGNLDNIAIFKVENGNVYA
ncbi:MAG: DNA replication/repair protein RecF [Chitinophagales bacterium]